jgi:hypothetical protein
MEQPIVWAYREVGIGGSCIPRVEWTTGVNDASVVHEVWETRSMVIRYVVVMIPSRRNSFLSNGQSYLL